MKDKKCMFGHECTSSCGNDYDCPCQVDHCCAITDNCEGCDNHYTLSLEKYNWSPITNEKIKWAGVDFDDTIASNSSFPDYIPGAPLPGAIESIKKLDALGYKITIFTARPWFDYANIEAYCKHYDIPVRRIICGKPLLRFMIDDKAVAFNGDWDKSVEDALKL